MENLSNTQSEKVEQYCEVIGAPSGIFSSKIAINIDYGDAKIKWNDNRLKNEDGSVKKFNSMIDALNYMGSEGWKLVNAFPVTLEKQHIYHYVFKKEFEKKDTAQ